MFLGLSALLFFVWLYRPHQSPTNPSITCYQLQCRTDVRALIKCVPLKYSASFTVQISSDANIALGVEDRVSAEKERREKKNKGRDKNKNKDNQRKGERSERSKASSACEN